ncbi:uncharacterized protein EAE97_001768 [Botrytis byssoidea]|uniref:Uncharacterized protein n=1 Tax=Botrytis byssoidea TaxID=139641 RepID=A0A9P5IV71_9HELO|nr:uncharacterized protein EAE97_001768 [Botrytis byssoidea]KAF7952271.1 hypothetical protein EAE97_001768 [Botrytis byssoidea]
MSEIVSGRPTNRCLRLSLPVHSNFPNKVEILKFNFDSEVFTAVREKIIVCWRIQAGIEVAGNWMEDNTAPYVEEWADLIPKAMNSQERTFFVVAWSWDEDEVQVAENEANLFGVGFKDEVMAGWAKTFTRYTFLLPKSVQTVSRIEEIEPVCDIQPESTVDCLASLLRHPPSRVHRQTQIKATMNYDTKHIESIYDAAVGKRHFVGPKGTYKKMGLFHSNMHKIYARSEVNRVSRLRKPPNTDVLWLEIKSEGLDNDIFTTESLMELREHIKKDVGYRASLYWGRSWIQLGFCNQTSPKPIDLTLKSQIVQDLVKDFIAKTGALTKEPGAFKAGFPYQPNPNSEGFPIMEVTTFEVSNNIQTTLIFQDFHSSYQNDIKGMERSWVTLLRDDPPDFTSPPADGSVTVKQVGINVGYFFHNSIPSPPVVKHEVEEARTPTKSYFTAITMPRSVDAMREWYTDFANHCEDYERLGHRVDLVRMFCEDLDAIDSKVSDMVVDCYEISKAPMPKSWSSSCPR